jgi:hypothetical protein
MNNRREQGGRMSLVIIEGFYRDRLLDAGGREIYISGWRKNLIVTNCRVLLAGFMKNDAALGVQSLQVGRGDPAWDATGAPAPDPGTTKLTDGSPFVIPLASLTLQYLDGSDAVSATPTNAIQITATLGPGQPTPATSPPYPLREFALFGTLGGQPAMIDYVRHPLIQKDGAVSLERKVRLVF